MNDHNAVKMLALMLAGMLVGFLTLIVTVELISK